MRTEFNQAIAKEREGLLEEGRSQIHYLQKICIDNGLQYWTLTLHLRLNQEYFLINSSSIFDQSSKTSLFLFKHLSKNYNEW